MTEDEKVHDIAIAMIRRKSMSPEEWQYTCIGRLHHLLAKEFLPALEELVVASAKISSDSWYVFTTRRLLTCFKGRHAEANLAKLERTDFGNFKGLGAKPTRMAEIVTQVAIFNFSDGSELKFEYETGKASMAPIYAAKYWQNKNPVLSKRS
jgi:hypothetical protein